MMCGSKRFLVKVKLNEKNLIKQVAARTPVAARKIIRGEYGYSAEILSVREEKRNPKSGD